MANQSGITPLLHRVLVKPIEVEKKTASGIVLTSTTVVKDEQAQIQAEVIELGEGAYSDTAGSGPQVGAMVLIAKYAGLVYQGKDKANYRLVNDLDVVAQLEEGFNV